MRSDSNASARSLAALGTPRWVVAALIAAGCLAYANSLGGAFVFDDVPTIETNPAHRSLQQPWVLVAPRGLVDYSFALNYAVGRLDPIGYHLVNLAIHLATGLALFGLVRRTLGSRRQARDISDMAMPLALAIALLWLVHPLTTQAVTYVCQRYESTAAMFYLLGLYAFCRGSEAAANRLPGDPQRSGARRWFAVVIVCFVLGMRSKETLFTFPLVLACYDRALVAGSWRGVLQRKYFYLTLLLAAVLLAGPSAWLAAQGVGRQLVGPATAETPASGARTTVVEVEGLTPWSYLLSQPGVILHYLRLCVWPVDLCFDYDWPVAHTATSIVLPSAVLLFLLALTVWGMFRYPGAAFLGAAFFLFLLPSSSIIPIRDLAVEHRMYLPLAAVIAALVLGAYALAVRGRRAALRSQSGGGKGAQDRSSAVPNSRSIYAATVLLAIPLASLTILRNIDYGSAISLWEATVRVRPENARAISVLALAYHQAGREDEALSAARRAAEIGPVHRSYDLAALLHMLGRIEEAQSAYQKTLELSPNHEHAHNNLGRLLEDKGQIEAAREHYRHAAELDPTYMTPHLNLGNSLAASGDFAGAAREYQQALSLEPLNPYLHLELAKVLARSNRADEAIEHCRAAAHWAPEHPQPYFELAKLLAEQRRYAEAIAQLQIVLRLEAGNSEARALLLHAQARQAPER